jgi:CrcB protein
MSYLYLSIGAVAGAILRYQIGVWFAGSLSSPAGFPWPTFLINITGSFLLGIIMQSVTSYANNRELRIMLATGFCGSYTTFSTFSHETVTLMREGATSMAALYLFLSVLFGIAAYFAGYLIGRTIR